MRGRPALDLFLVSWLVLFLELACIRWFPAHVLFLSFFTNTVLLACFVGMSIGLLTARKKANYITHTPLILAVALGVGLLTDLFSQKLMYVLTPADQTAKSEVVFFGSETNAATQKDYHVPVELVAAIFFGLVASLMVGPGQEMGRAFNRVASRSTAYSVNLLGSFAGIVSFAVLSEFQMPPFVWFIIAAMGILHFSFRAKSKDASVASPSPLMGVVFLLVGVVLTLPTSGVGFALKQKEMQTQWSPYYRIDFYPSNLFVDTNRVSHQVMISRKKALLAGYALPFLFARDLPQADPEHKTWPQFKRVLIIGAGSGNDLSRALQWCPPDAKIDAVEIDPVIQKLGREYHPDKPYADPRVTLHINDGRNFLKKVPDGEYDLVVFALIDSLVLHSGYSNLRLENFLFTLESFQDVKRVMKPTGLFTVYNYFRQGWLVARLNEMLTEVFKNPPIVLTAPPKDKIELNVPDYDAFTAFFSGSPEALDPLKRAFKAADNSFWLAFKTPPSPDSVFGFQKEQPTGGPPPLPESELSEDIKYLKVNWGRMRMTEVEKSNGTLPPATDDWPFLYVKQPTIPGHTWRGVGLTLIMSFLVWLLFSRGPDEEGTTEAAQARRGEFGLIARSFFLGAGFMLVETKAVVHMALLFGSTWQVNTVVFAAVLMMALAGNLLAAAIKPKNLSIFYVGLFAALAAGILIPLGAFLGLDRGVQIAGACALVFAPIAFAGVVFAGTFRRTTQPDRMFGANIIGALFGGLAENSSMLLGFQYLLCVAVGFYLLSALFGNRAEVVPEKV